MDFVDGTVDGRVGHGDNHVVRFFDVAPIEDEAEPLDELVDGDVEDVL